jgi:hypothetical protein
MITFGILLMISQEDLKIFNQCNAPTLMAHQSSLLLPFIVISGFFKNSEVVWMAAVLIYLSAFKYGFAAIMQNYVSNRDSLVSLLNFDMGVWSSIRALVGLRLIFRGLSYYLLWLKKRKIE